MPNCNIEIRENNKYTVIHVIPFKFRNQAIVKHNSTLALQKHDDTKQLRLTGKFLKAACETHAINPFYRSITTLPNDSNWNRK